MEENDPFSRYRLAYSGFRTKAELDDARTAAARKSPFTSWKQLCDYYGNRCLRCGRRDLPLTKDHVIPRSHGGPDNLSNYQPLCGPCNRAKADRVIDYRKRGPHTPVVDAYIRRIIQSS